MPKARSALEPLPTIPPTTTHLEQYHDLRTRPPPLPPQHTPPHTHLKPRRIPTPPSRLPTAHCPPLPSLTRPTARGLHRVTSAFLPLLDPAGGRVVNVTSAAGPNFVSKCSPERQAVLTDPAVTLETIEVCLLPSSVSPFFKTNYRWLREGGREGGGGSRVCPCRWLRL